MNTKRKIICEKPNFEISRVKPDGTEQIEVYTLKDFTSQLPETSMDRRGFLGLSVFAGVTGFAAAIASKAYAAEEAVRFAAIPRESVRVSTGEIVRIDKEKDIVCIKETERAEELCIDITPETEIEVDGQKKTIYQLQVGKSITVRYTISFTGERRAISISSPIMVWSAPKPVQRPVPAPRPSNTGSCGHSTGVCR